MKLTWPNYLLRTIVSLAMILVLSSCAHIGKAGINMASPVTKPLIDKVMGNDNLQLSKDGLPTLVVLISALVDFSPENLDLLTAASMAYAAQGLLVEDTDPEYADQLYLKSKEYGLRALKTNANFRDATEKEGLKLMDATHLLDKKYAPALFWAGMGWASWIFLNIDDSAALMGLPTIRAFMVRVEELDESYFFGGVHLFQMAYNAVMPSFAGGGPEKVEAELEKLMPYSNGEMMLAYVYYAKFYARPYGEKEKFHNALMKVMNAKTTIDNLKLINALAKDKAQLLLAKEEEYFEYEIQ